MPTFRFEPSARLQKVLGRELIADPNVAIGEFVKNSYDTGAGEVTLSFEISVRNKEAQVLAIADDGVGMDADSFERNWMHPGYSDKAEGAPTPRLAGPPRSVAERLLADREPVGEKGVGRLAAGRLGGRAEVWTRRDVGDRWLYVDFEWSQFEQMDVALRDVRIPYEFVEDAPLMPYATGTLIVVSDLSTDWTARVPGRKVYGRSDLRLGRLAEDLGVLVQPLSVGAASFALQLSIDDAELNQEFGGKITASEPDRQLYRYDFDVKMDKRGAVVVRRKVRRSPDVAERFDRDEEELDTVILDGSNATEESGYDEDARSLYLRCGPFKGYFLYSTAPWRKSPLLASPGVRVYRDGIRVPPYGDLDDDWLGARSRKASRQGYAIQPKHLWGQVSISRQENRGLDDMSNRDGLLQNESFEDFVSHARGEFRNFAETIMDEYVKEEWETPEARASRQASNIQAYQQAMAQALVHGLRGPLNAVRVEVDAIGMLIPRLATDDGRRIKAKLQRATDRIDELDARIDEFLNQINDPEDLTEFDLRKAVSEGVDRAAGLAESLGVDVDVSFGRLRDVTGLRAAVVEGVAGLVTNAVQAPRPPERAPGAVSVDVRGGGSGYLIVVSDDGLGLDQDAAAALFTETRIRKGRVGKGLLHTRQMLAFIGGKVDMVENSDEGAVFQIEIPSIGTIRKEAR